MRGMSETFWRAGAPAGAGEIKPEKGGYRDYGPGRNAPITQPRAIILAVGLCYTCSYSLALLIYIVTLEVTYTRESQGHYQTH